MRRVSDKEISKSDEFILIVFLPEKSYDNRLCYAVKEPSPEHLAIEETI